MPTEELKELEKLQEELKKLGESEAVKALSKYLDNVIKIEKGMENDRKNIGDIHDVGIPKMVMEPLEGVAGKIEGNQILLLVFTGIKKIAEGMDKRAVEIRREKNDELERENDELLAKGKAKINRDYRARQVTHNVYWGVRSKPLMSPEFARKTYERRYDGIAFGLKPTKDGRLVDDNGKPLDKDNSKWYDRGKKIMDKTGVNEFPKKTTPDPKLLGEGKLTRMEALYNIFTIPVGRVLTNDTGNHFVSIPVDPPQEQILVGRVQNDLETKHAPVYVAAKLGDVEVKAESYTSEQLEALRPKDMSPENFEKLSEKEKEARMGEWDKYEEAMLANLLYSLGIESKPAQSEVKVLTNKEAEELLIQFTKGEITISDLNNAYVKGEDGDILSLGVLLGIETGSNQTVFTGLNEERKKAGKEKVVYRHDPSAIFCRAFDVRLSHLLYTASIAQLHETDPEILDNVELHFNEFDYDVLDLGKSVAPDVRPVALLNQVLSGRGVKDGERSMTTVSYAYGQVESKRRVYSLGSEWAKVDQNTTIIARSNNGDEIACNLKYERFAKIKGSMDGFVGHNVNNPEHLDNFEKPSQMGMVKSKKMIEEVNKRDGNLYYIPPGKRANKELQELEVKYRGQKKKWFDSLSPRKHEGMNDDVFPQVVVSPSFGRTVSGRS